MSNCPKCQAEVNKGDNYCWYCGHPLHDSLTGEKPQGFDNIRETSAHAPKLQYNIKEQLVQMLEPLLEPFQSQLEELIQKQNNNTASLEAEREEINQINNEISKLKEGWQRQLEEEILTPFQSQLQELTQKQNNNIAFLEAEREKLTKLIMRYQKSKRNCNNS